MSAGLLIIGGGAAGVEAAFKARALHPTLPITLVTGEHPTPYARPSLMYLMMGQLRLADLALRPEERWREANITRVWGWVRALEPRCARVETLEGSRELTFERLILATGARPRLLPCEGADLKGVGCFGGLADLATLSELIPTTQRALVVGGGLIGAELTEALLTRGVSVRLVAREARYAPHLLNAHESALVEEELRAMGAKLTLGASLEQLHGEEREGGEGRVSSATLITQEGERERVGCELVAGAIGAEPNTQLTAQLGLRLINPEQARAQGRPEGVWVDERFQTSLEGVFAVGDCASALAHTPQTERSEAWPRGWVSAQQQGERAAYEALSDLLTPTLSPLEPPSVPLLIPEAARYGRLTHKSLGEVRSPIQHVWRAPRTLWRRARLLTLYEREGRLVGVSALETPLEVNVWRPLIREGVSVEETARVISKERGLRRFKRASHPNPR